MASSDLETISDTGKPPEERFASAQQVREHCNDLIYADNSRATRRKEINGLIDGNPPYSRELIENWRSNFNPREAEGLIQAVRTPYYDLVFEPGDAITLESDWGDSEEQQAVIASIIAQEFREALFSWRGIDWHIQMQQNEMLVHGVGVHVRTSLLDWRPRTFRTGRVLFPDGTSSDPIEGGLEYFSVRDKMKPTDLYRKITGKEGEAMGWQKKEGFAAIKQAAQMGGAGNASDETEVQARLRNGDIGGSRGWSEIDVCHLFAQEFDGKISHYIVTESANVGTGNEYLFKKTRRFKCWDEVLHVFPYDIGGDGTIHGVKGLGARFFHNLFTSAKVINSIVDAVLLSTGVMVSQDGNYDPQQLQMLSVGLLKILPQGLKIESQRVNDVTQGPLALLGTLQRTLSDNTKTFRSTLSQNDLSADPSANEVSTISGDQSRLRQSQHSLYYRHYGHFLRETLRRMLIATKDTPAGDIAVQFRERCIKRGVPKEALKWERMHNIAAVKDIGSGSAEQKMRILNQFMQILYPISNEEERAVIKKAWAQGLVGHQLAAQFVTDNEAESIKTNDEAIATLENNDFEQGQSAIVVSAQNHLRHAMTHRELAVSTIEALRSGQMPPEQAQSVLEPLLTHQREHIGRMEDDPTRKAQADSLFKEWVEMTKLVDQLRQQTGEARAAREEKTQELSEKGQLERHRIELEAQNKRFEIEVNARLEQEKFAASQPLNDAKAAAQIAA